MDARTMDTRTADWLIPMRTNRLLVAMFVAVAGSLAMLWLVDPATSGLFPPCPVHYLTGWYCPGCGSLRAIHRLLHGELREAWAMNPLTVVLLPFLTYGLASAALFEVGGIQLPQPLIRAGWIHLLCAVILLFGIARNLPVHPFDLLAPGALLRL